MLLTVIAVNLVHKLLVDESFYSFLLGKKSPGLCSSEVAVMEEDKDRAVLAQLLLCREMMGKKS